MFENRLVFGECAYKLIILNKILLFGRGKEPVDGRTMLDYA